MATQLYILTGITSNSTTSVPCPAYTDTVDTYNFTLYDQYGIVINAPITIVLGISGTTLTGGGPITYPVYNPTISIGNSSTSQNVDININNDNSPACPCPCNDQTTITDVYVVTSDPNYIITFVSSAPTCTCTYIDVTITQLDLDSASGNTNPSQDGVVYYQYTDCDTSSFAYEPYTVSGIYTDSVCVLTSQIGSSFFYYYENDVQIDSITSPLDFTSSYSIAGCCAPTLPTPTPTTTATQTPTTTTTATPTPTEPYDIYLFEDCFNSSNQFRYEYVPGTLTVGDVYQITGGVGFNGYAQVIAYSAVGTIYNGNGVMFVGGTTLCPSPSMTSTPTTTPTPTITPTATLGPTPTTTSTPSPTPTVGTCDSVYCFRTTLSSLSGYSGNYTQTGTYNSNDYYVGDGTSYGVIYYTGDRWCLSTTLGGTCLLEGSYPCYSPCPDISANYFNGGICPTPTPTPINCDIFDFTAYFDCDWEPVPTPTPSVACDDVDFKFSSFATTPTPTPSGAACDGANVSFVICQVDEPTPTVTLTPTLTLTKTVDVQGQVTFTMLDEVFSCVSVKVLVDCQTGEELYTSDNLVFSGIPITTGITMFASVNGNNVCVTYDRDDSNISSNANVTNIVQIYSICADCSTIPTPTPTTTSTPTNTPTTTSTPTNTPTSSEPLPTTTPTQTPTQTQTPTPSVTIGLTPTMTPSNTASPTQTPTTTPTNTSTPTSTPTETPTNTPTNTMTPTPSVTPNYVYVYESCSVISPNVLPTQVIQTIQLSWITVPNTTFKDNSGNCWKFVGQYPSTYIAPPTVTPITFAGDYFTTAYTTVYVDCVDCINTPLCFDYSAENITSVSFGVTQIRFGLVSTYVCPGYTFTNVPIPVGDSICIHSTVPLPNGLALIPKWADNHLPDPVLGVDYTLTLNGNACL